jgi:branched-chain amino acid transport system ATP-binding protein
MTHTPSLLQLSSIGKQFGGLSALSDVSLHIQRGEIYGLIGPNGAGKTTLFNVLTGLYQPSSGHFNFNGTHYQAGKPHVLARAGIARTFQNIRLFANLTALENVMIGRHVRTRAGVFGALLRNRATRNEEHAITERARELLRYVGIEKPAQMLAKHLSYGEQRRLEIARALATDPLLLALDEPAAGMNATETASLKTLLQTIRSSGITVLLIEHDVKLIMGLCDRVAVLDYGKKIAEGVPEQVRKDPAVIAAYLGSSPSSGGELASRPVGAGKQIGTQPSNLLEVRDLKVAYGGIQALKGIGFHVAPGELVALIGSNGAGKSTTLKTLAGLLHPVGGQIQFDGQSLKNIASHQRAAMGIALVPEGRGVFARMTVAENLLMGAYSRSDKSEITTDLERMYGLFSRLAERKDQPAGTLSGGEQQMVAMARALMSRPRLLMLDEPSMGLAPLMVEKIFATIRDIAALGMSILLVEQNARLALEVAQHGYVMESGVITLSGAAGELMGSDAVQRAYLGN